MRLNASKNPAPSATATLAISPNEVRARFNLAFVHARTGDHGAALGEIADTLALGRTGQYRDRLLQKQAAVLQLAAAKNQAEYAMAEMKNEE